MLPRLRDVFFLDILCKERTIVLKLKLRRCISFFIVLSLILSAGAVCSFAENVNEPLQTDAEKPYTAANKNSSFEELMECFDVSKSENGMKYASFSPVRDENDDTKYPLVIYIHGRFHGWTDKSFVKSGLTYWCMDEIQSMFDTGGAHLLMPKDNESPISFNMPEKVYQVIDEYIENNRDSVDTDRIYLMGGSRGGKIAWKILVSHPGVFSAAVMLSSTKIPNEKEAKLLSDVPIWEISAVTDPVAFFALFQRPAWKRISEFSNVKDICRWTVFDRKVTLPDGKHPFITHFLAKTIGYNLCLFDDDSVLPGCTTVDGEGTSIELSIHDSIVQWMNGIRLKKTDETENTETDQQYEFDTADAK